jgi:hypothetical protein
MGGMMVTAPGPLVDAGIIVLRNDSNDVKNKFKNFK